MVRISDCSCECRDKGRERQIEERALSSINKILGTEGQAYYPDGTGAVTIPVADADQLAQIDVNSRDIATLEEGQKKTSTDISQMKISIAENEGEIAKIQTASDAQAREIATIKADDGSRDTEIVGLKTRMASAEGDISDIHSVDAGQTSDIEGLKTKASQQGTQISGLDALCESITKSLVTDVEVGVGTDAGSFIVSVIEEDGTRRSSDSFQYGRVGTFALMQGTQPGYVRGVLTLVDGTTVTSNDFQIVTVTGSDIYVTAITLQPDYQAGTLGGTIGYSNGASQAINAVEIPTSPGVTTNINGLLSRMSAVEAKGTSQDASITDLQTRVKSLEDEPTTGLFSNTAAGLIRGSTTDGKISAESDGTGSVSGWSTVKSDIASKASQADLNSASAKIEANSAEIAKKADASALVSTNAEVAKKADKTALDSTNATLVNLQQSVGECFNEVDYDSATQELSFTALDGQVNTVGPIGGGGGEKTLQTAPLSEFSTVDPVSNYITIAKELVIELIMIGVYGEGIALVRTTTLTIPKTKIHLSQDTLEWEQYAWLNGNACKISNGKYIYINNHAATQITTDEIPFNNPSDWDYYYRIYA